MTKVKAPGGFEGEFGQQLVEAEQKAQVNELPVVPVPPANQDDRQTIGSDNTRWRAAMRLVESGDPWAAVLRAWREVEKVIMDETEETVGTGSLSYSALSARVPPTLKDLYERLRKLRNTAVHSRKEVITSVEAEEYIQLCQRFVEAVAEMRRGGYGDQAYGDGTYGS
jgi:hypothetical protein